MALGKNIQRIREEKGLSQDALAKLTGWSEETPGKGVSQGAISALEKRDSTSSKHAPAIALALGVQIGDLLGIHVPHKACQLPAMYAITDPVVEDLSALDPEDADVWRAQIRAAAIKARKAKQEESKKDRTAQSGPGDPTLEGRRTA